MGRSAPYFLSHNHWIPQHDLVLGDTEVICSIVVDHFDSPIHPPISTDAVPYGRDRNISIRKDLDLEVLTKHTPIDQPSNQSGIVLSHPRNVKIAGLHHILVDPDHIEDPLCHHDNLLIIAQHIHRSSDHIGTEVSFRIDLHLEPSEIIPITDAPIAEGVSIRCDEEDTVSHGMELLQSVLIEERMLIADHPKCMQFIRTEITTQPEFQILILLGFPIQHIGLNVHRWIGRSDPSDLLSTEIETVLSDELRQRLIGQRNIGIAFVTVASASTFVDQQIQMSLSQVGLRVSTERTPGHIDAVFYFSEECRLLFDRGDYLFNNVDHSRYPLRSYLSII